MCWILPPCTLTLGSFWYQDIFYLIFLAGLYFWRVFSFFDSSIRVVLFRIECLLYRVFKLFSEFQLGKIRIGYISVCLHSCNDLVQNDCRLNVMLLGDTWGIIRNRSIEIKISFLNDHNRCTGCSASVLEFWHSTRWLRAVFNMETYCLGILCST